jgi:two-component sensor histidine kinase
MKGIHRSHAYRYADAGAGDDASRAGNQRCKYDALWSPNHRVSVHWDRHSNGDAAASLTIAWREFGGPSIVAPIQSGYGTNLLRELIPHELGGKVDLLLQPRARAAE